jgi:3-deoxy-D-manno-octulosonic acid kinase
MALGDDDWRKLGRLLRRFHDAGLDHADLNAHNILRDAGSGFWLIDFDQGRLRSQGGWREGNLRRLLRSLRKLRRQSPRFCWTEADWAALQAGYEEGGSTRTGRSLS